MKQRGQAITLDEDHMHVWKADTAAKQGWQVQEDTTHAEFVHESRGRRDPNSFKAFQASL